MKLTIFLFFILSTFFSIFYNSFFHFNINFYIPFLILIFLKRNFLFSIWIACICGVILDVFSFCPIGINATSLVISSLILYNKKTLFKTSLKNTAIFTAIFSIIYSIIYILLSFILFQKITFSIFGILTDFIIGPIFDGIYAILFFSVFFKIENILNNNLLKRKNEK